MPPRKSTTKARDDDDQAPDNAVSMRVSDMAPPNLDDREDALEWIRSDFMLPAVDPEQKPWDAALPRYLREAVHMVGAQTGHPLRAFVATAGFHRGADFLHRQAAVLEMDQARRSVQRSGWSTSSLDWDYTLHGCGRNDHIELRHIGPVYAGRGYGLMETLGLTRRAVGGLCILFGVVDLKLRGSVGRQAEEQAREFLAELPGQVAKAKQLVAQAARDPGQVTTITRDQLWRQG